MQASLRSNYQQYYDYGSLDCATTDQTNHQHDHQLLQDTVNSITQHHHDIIQLSSQTATNQHNHQLLQDIPQGIINLDHQQSVDSAAQSDVNCYTNPQDVLTDTRTVSESEQLVIYNQSHNHYQLMPSANDHRINSNGSSHETEIRATGTLEISEGVENLYHIQQHQQHVQTTSYQTIYYEPINYTENCAIEPVQSGNCEPQEQQAFTDHTLHSNQFTEQHQQSEQHHHHNQLPPPSSVSVDGNYFQYVHPPTDRLVGSNQNHHSESPLSSEAINHQHPPPASYADSQQPIIGDNHSQIYRTTLEINNHPFEQLDHINQTTSDDHFRLQSGQPDVQQHSCGPQFDQNKQDRYHDLAAATNNGHEQLHYGHNYYLDAESTGVSIAHSRESRSPAASTASSESEESSASTLTRDEKRAREANIPISYYEIVNLSIEQFNEQLSKYSLSESQLSLIKDIRRRGKNKVAAQSCRKRKMEQIYELQHEVNHLASKRRSLTLECSQLIKEHGNLVHEYDKIYAMIQEQCQYETIK